MKTFWVGDMSIKKRYFETTIYFHVQNIWNIIVWTNKLIPIKIIIKTIFSTMSAYESWYTYACNICTQKSIGTIYGWLLDIFE